MTTALRILSGIFTALAGLLFYFRYIMSGVAFSALAIATLLLSLFTHRKEEIVKKGPLKIIFLCADAAFTFTHEGDPMEWDTFIRMWSSFPKLPFKLKSAIQSHGIDSFDLIDLENKKTITFPKNTSKLKTRSIAFVHKDFMSDVPIEAKAFMISKTYFTA